MKSFRIASIAGSLLLLSSAVAANGLDARIEAAMDKDRAGSGVVSYSLSNNSKADLLVLAWETPLRGVEDDLFEIRRDGRPVEYVGRHYKRGLPDAGDYIQIKAGETLRAVVDLSAHYAMRDAGTYQVQFVGHFHDSFSIKAAPGNSESLVPVSDRDLRSGTVSLWVDGNAQPYSSEPVGVLNISKAGSTSFVGCSNSQVTSTSSGHGAAQTMSSGANSYLAAGTKGSRYTTWFGTYSSGNYNTVKSHFTSIGGALNNQAVTYHCDCSSSAYAYVYPNQPYNIHLCNAFWNAPTTGTDSKGGTIVHEISHFDIVANTDDLAYGQTACKKLAKNASRAIRNADSHEYFAENTPALN